MDPSCSPTPFISSPKRNPGIKKKNPSQKLPPMTSVSLNESSSTTPTTFSSLPLSTSPSGTLSKYIPLPPPSPFMLYSPSSMSFPPWPYLYPYLPSFVLPSSSFPFTSMNANDSPMYFHPSSWLKSPFPNPYEVNDAYFIDMDSSSSSIVHQCFDMLVQEWVRDEAGRIYALEKQQSYLHDPDRFHGWLLSNQLEKEKDDPSKLTWMNSMASRIFYSLVYDFISTLAHQQYNHVLLQTLCVQPMLTMMLDDWIHQCILELAQSILFPIQSSWNPSQKGLTWYSKNPTYLKVKTRHDKESEVTRNEELERSLLIALSIDGLMAWNELKQKEEHFLVALGLNAWMDWYQQHLK